MSQVTSEELLQFAKTMSGQSLQTMRRRKAFTVELRGDTLVYTPSSTGKPRPHEREYLEKICDAFRATKSFNPGDYRTLTYNASYTLALIAAFVKEGKPN